MGHKLLEFPEFPISIFQCSVLKLLLDRLFGARKWTLFSLRAAGWVEILGELGWFGPVWIRCCFHICLGMIGYIPKKYSNWSWFLMLIPKVGSWFATDFFGERLVERIRNWKGYTGSMGINNCHCSLWLQFAWFNFAELFEKCHWTFFFSSFCPDGLWKKYILCAFSSLKRINDPRASDWRTTQHVFRGHATGFSCEIWRTKTKTDPSGTSKELIASGYSFLDSQKRSGRALRSYDWFIIYIQPRPTVDTSTITPSYCILVSSQHCWIGWSDYPLQIIFEGTMGSPISTLLQVSTFNGSQFAANPLIIIDYPWLANIYI